MMQSRKVTGYQFFHFSCLQSGTVQYNNTVIGHTNSHHTMPQKDESFGQDESDTPEKNHNNSRIKAVHAQVNRLVHPHRYYHKNIFCTMFFHKNNRHFKSEMQIMGRVSVTKKEHCGKNGLLNSRNSS